MYLSHFFLNLKPFQITTDQRFLYLSDKHKEALAILNYGIEDNRGVLVLTGDVGTGKTILVHALMDNLGPEVKTALIQDPSLKGLDFFNFVAHAFGMETEFKTKGEFLINFGNFLDGLFKTNRQVVLILDEAQYIDPVQLEEIRILSDLERENNRRLNIFFVGQDEFNLLLADPYLRALKQRITTHYHIGPLSLKETSGYVEYRLRVAGCDRQLFTPPALKRIFKLTNGYPRLINIICDHCLLVAFVKDLHQIDPAIVKECAADLMHPSQFKKKADSPLENQSRIANKPAANIQPSAGPKTLPAVTTQTTKPFEFPERPKSLAFLRKPACLFAMVVLLSALVWFHFRDNPNPNPQASSRSSNYHKENQAGADVNPKENDGVPSATIKPDDNTPPDGKAEAAERVPHADPLSTPPATGVDDAPPVRSEKKGETAPVATETTYPSPHDGIDSDRGYHSRDSGHAATGYRK